jgi:hypothetical protein
MAADSTPITPTSHHHQTPNLLPFTDRELTHSPHTAGPFSLDPKPDSLSLFSPSNISQYHISQNVNSTSVLVSMYEAVQAFRNAPADASKTFIFTGNILNLKNLPGMLNFGLGKSGPAYAIRHVAETGIYKGEGIK